MIGMRIANYHVVAEIGAGGMGTVYRAVEATTQQTVAIKRLKPELATPEMLERFAREGEALRQLNHPNIVKVLATLQAEGSHILVMEYLDGGALYDVLKVTSQLPLNRVLSIALELADALARAHHLKIIHRDIKPANVLLASDGTPRLTDFGVAYLGNEKPITETGVAMGTLDYLSPEALNGEAVDARADLWAFGVMLFEMLAGQRPFHSETITGILTGILTQPTPDLEALRPDAPVALVDLIYRMLEKNRDQRIASARSVGAELEAIMQGRETPSHPIRHIEPATPTPADSTKPKHNLPAQTTPFVGREHEIAELTRLLEKSRLITILASGGMGKTRLALEVAGAHVGAPPQTFGNGVYFVALAPLTSPDFIVSTIAEAVNFQFYQGGEPKQQLLDFLREKSLLLIMDNFEHLLEGSIIVSDILQAAPNVKLIATSRERLNLTGETLFALSGMDFPAWETPQDALDYAAVKLFMQSALRIRPDFDLTANDLTYIARICRLVDGLPLGIVLAAAWVEMLTLAEIADEIAKSIDFLETEMRDIPERQRSIRAVFDYSWNLMTPDEQAVFMKLSVFRGGFTREAAQAVAGASLKTLMTLVNKSLLRRDVTSGRYEIHELLRQYAEEILQTTSESAQIRNVHSVYFADFMQKSWQPLRSSQQLRVLEGIDADIENVRAGWKWLVQNQRALELDKMVDSLWYRCHLRSSLHEGHDLFEQGVTALRAAPPSPEQSRVLGILIIMQAYFCNSLYHAEKGKVLALEGMNLIEPFGVPERTIFGLFTLALLHGETLEGGAERYARECLQLAWDKGLMWYQPLPLMILGTITQLHKHSLVEAREILEQALHLAEATSDPLLIGTIAGGLGWVKQDLGEYAEAKQLREQSLRVFKDIGYRKGEADMLQALAYSNYLMGDYTAALQGYRQVLLMFQNLGIMQDMMVPILNLAKLYLAQGDKPVAVEHYAFISHNPKYVWEWVREDASQTLEQLKLQLPEAEFEAAVARGKSLDINTVVAELLTES